LSEIVGIAARYVASGSRPSALATILSASGSTYRRAGARLLAFDDGSSTGSISGGCLESDILLLAREVIASGASRILTYRPGPDDILFGTGLGCEGELTILIEPVRKDLARGFARLADDPSAETLIAVTTLPDDVANAATTIVGERAPAGPPFQRIADGDAGTETFVQRIEPPFALTVFGASPEAGALVRIAGTLGWRVTLADHRAAAATEARFPDAAAIVVGPLESLVERAAPPRGSAAVVMTHNYLHDLTLLRGLANLDLSYLGLIGPRRRRERLLATLEDEGVSLSGENVFGPAGFDLGAEHPEEIALSLAAQVQSVRARSKGGSLRDRELPIHERPAGEGVAVIVLAAGGSTRLGEPKALVPIAHETLVGRATHAALGSGAAGVFVVAGDETDAIAEILEETPAAVVRNPDWERGIATSIRAGLHAAAERTQHLRAVIIMLCDQPFMTASHVERLMTAWSETGAPAVATAYPEGPGVPALFPSDAFDALRALDDRSGARTILRTLGDSVVTIDAIDTRDIDTPDDKRAILERCAIDPRGRDPEGDPDD